MSSRNSWMCCAAGDIDLTVSVGSLLSSGFIGEVFLFSDCNGIECPIKHTVRSMDSYQNVDK